MAYAKAMLETHPWPGHVDRKALADCIEACAECVQACTSCAGACLSEDGVRELRIRLYLDCADVCETTGRVLTRQAEYDAPASRAQLEACRTACASCQEECRSPADHDEHCRICADACGRCGEACERLLNAMTWRGGDGEPHR